MRRILLTPDAGDGGGATSPPPAENPPKTEAATPPPPPAPPAPNPLAADLAALRAQVAEFENEKTERERLRIEAEEKKLVEKGEYEKLIKQRDERLAAESKKAAAAEARAKTYALSSQLAIAFSGHDLYPGSAEDLSKLWRDDFEAVADGDGFVVRAKDGRPVKDVIAERLATERYSNHVKATSRSSAGGGAGDKPAPSQNGDNKEPASYEEWTKQVLQIDDHRPAPLFGLTGRRPAAR